ncbi:MAG TPA: glycosyltransferase family 4 protein [Vicinamibacterales bacterium]|nr:glycosyltransferase family 4 protein [Vicinamibacterales bacterium]
MRADQGTRVLAVPLLGERSGGVGQVSGLLQRAMENAWPGQTSVVRLLPDHRRSPTLIDKVSFGCSVNARQMVRRARWILFAHLGLARVDRWVPRGLRAPYAVFLHGVEAWQPLSSADRDLLAGARLRIANSQFTARRAAEANPGIGPVEVCPLAFGSGAETSGGPRGERRMVLVVGRMAAGERYKGHDELITAWPAVLRQEPEAELVFAGDGDDRLRLEALARATPGGARIRFAGFVSRAALEELYAEAAVFAMPSRNEGFGLVYLEAMAHRLPCVGSIHDAAGEVVLDGETGLLVDAGHPQALAHAITTLLGDPALRRRMGDAGHARWRRLFTFAHFQSRMTSLLDAAFEAEVPA